MKINIFMCVVVVCMFLCCFCVMMVLFVLWLMIENFGWSFGLCVKILLCCVCWLVCLLCRLMCVVLVCWIWFLKFGFVVV